jgi:hypothetical protein
MPIYHLNGRTRRRDTDAQYFYVYRRCCRGEERMRVLWGSRGMFVGSVQYL